MTESDKHADDSPAEAAAAAAAPAAMTDDVEIETVRCEHSEC